MDSWTCQSGFPVLTFNITTGTISQEKIHNKKRENSTDFYKYVSFASLSELCALCFALFCFSFLQVTLHSVLADFLIFLLCGMK